jgi:uncharacterized protein (TIGR02145 family)
MKKLLISLCIILFMIFSSMSISQNAPITSIPKIEQNYLSTYVDVPIYVSNFKNINAVSLTLKYDTTSLKLVGGESNIQFTLFSNTPNKTNEIKIGGYVMQSVSLPDSSILYTLKFKTNGKQSILYFYDYGESCEYTSGPTVLNDIPTDNYYKNGMYNPYVKIGTQIWMSSNLNIGTMIPNTTLQTNNNTIEKWCYGNDENNCNIFGGYYQWNEMMQYQNTVGNKGICPDGWHIPTIQEWEYLTYKTMSSDTQSYQMGIRKGDIGLFNTSGWAIKTDQKVPNNSKPTVGNAGWANSAVKDMFGVPIKNQNSTGFNALPTGWVSNKHGFGAMYYTTFMWSSEKRTYQQLLVSTTYTTPVPVSYQLYLNHSSLVPIGQAETMTGLSVRCIKDGSQSIYPPMQETILGDCPVIMAPNVESFGLFDIPIKIKNFKNITNGDLYIGFNPSYLNINSVIPNQNVTLTYSFPSDDVINIKINTSSLTLNDNSTLFTLKCQSIKTETTISPLKWEINSNWNVQPVKSRFNYFIDGSVKMPYVDPVKPMPITDNTTIVAENKTVVITMRKFGYGIKVENFKDVKSFNFVLKFDPNVIKIFAVSKNQTLTGTFSYKLIASDQMKITWSSNGVTIPNNTFIITLTTELLSTTWKGKMPVEFVTTDGKTYKNGSITIK